MKLALLLTCTVLAFARPKVAILDVRKALVSTEDGKAATAALHRKFDPDEAKLSEQQAEIDRLRAQHADEAQIESLVRARQRATEEARQRFDVEQKRVYKELSGKLLVAVKKYAKQKHFDVVLDESDSNTPVLWRDDKIDITDEIVKLYDRARNP